MGVKFTFSKQLGLVQEQGKGEASFQNGLSVSRNVSLSTSQVTGVSETSGSLLQLKGRAEGIHFHLGGNQYISSNCWFNADHPEHSSGRWVYETTSGAAFRWGFLDTKGVFELDWAKSGTQGHVITGSSNASFGTALSLSASNGSIGIGKKASLGLSATFDVTGSNAIAFAVTGSADIGGGAPDSFFALPRLTNDQRNALTNVFDGQIIYNTSAAKFQGRAGGAWVNLH